MCMTCAQELAVVKCESGHGHAPEKTNVCGNIVSLQLNIDTVSLILSDCSRAVFIPRGRGILIILILYELRPRSSTSNEPYHLSGCSRVVRLTSSIIEELGSIPETGKILCYLLPSIYDASQI